jgi:hypothetical protein
MSEGVVTIYGASDDLVEVEGVVSGCDEYNTEDASFVLVGDSGQARVRCWYGRKGVWGIAVSPVDDGIPMLAVAIEGASSGYSAQATISGVLSVVREHNTAS